MRAKVKQEVQNNAMTSVQNKKTNYKGPHYMHGSTQRVDNREQQVDFLQKRWLDREQELVTVIQEETKRTEEKEEAR